MASPESSKLFQTFGFDEVSIVPGEATINPELVDLSTEIAGIKLKFPIIAAAMDSVVDPDFAVKLSKLGSFAVLNLEGVQTRYENPEEALEKIRSCNDPDSTSIIQTVYSQEIEEDLIGKRVEEIKNKGGMAVVSATPAKAKRFGLISKEAGVDVFVVQSTVTTARHISKSPVGLKIDVLVKELKIPVLVGNTVSFAAATELAEMGVTGILCGVGPGTACTSREVLGIGVPQVSATIGCAAARDRYFEATGKYVSIITDGGFTKSGDICKAIAAGADAVMIGSFFAACQEAPGGGFHWGMATADNNLPRGSRIKLNFQTNLERLLFGPTFRTDGKENLVGALRMSMGLSGASNIDEFQKSQIIIAPSIRTEGKIYQ